jgi:hypothetical protein
MKHMVRDVAAATSQWQIVIAGIFQINQAFARIYSAAASTAILLWSVSALRKRRIGTWCRDLRLRNCDAHYRWGKRWARAAGCAWNGGGVAGASYLVRGGWVSAVFAGSEPHGESLETCLRLSGVEALHGLRRLRFPRIVGADVPDVTFGIGAGEAFAAVILFFQIHEYFGSGTSGAGVYGVDIGNDEVG